MPSTQQDKTITLQVTKEQLEFLQWISKQYGITIQEYLLRTANGKLVKEGK